MDRAITFLSSFKDNYSNTLDNVYFVCPNKNSAEISLDKKKFENYIMKNFDYLYPKLDNEFPIFGKPRYGFGSNGLKIINSEKEFQETDKNNYVFQKFYKNIEEYSVDCFYDDGVLIDCVPRIRLRIANGEVLDSVTFESLELTDICKKIGNHLSYDGPACIQFMRDKETNKLFIMEINARFGGGCILALKSGFDMLQCIIEKINKKQISHVKNSWKKKLVMKRVNTEYFFEK
jgi:carbamoyl-phosphate synthase large subunit